MERGIGTIIVIVVLLVLGVGGRLYTRSSAGAEYKQQAVALMQHVDGYSANPDYFTWLAESAHDAVFDDCCEYVRSGRRSRRLVVDEEKYFHSLLTRAMIQASQDHSDHIATALQTFRDTNFLAPDATHEQRRRFYKQQEERERGGR